MKNCLVAEPHWSTASIGCAAHTTPLELQALGDHLTVCQGLRGRLFNLQCRSDALRGFLGAHVVTSVVALAMLVGLGWLAA